MCLLLLLLQPPPPTLLVFFAVLALTCFLLPGLGAGAFTAPPPQSRTTLWSLSSPGALLTRPGGVSLTTTPHVASLAIAMRNNHGPRRANTAFFLNPALSGKKEENDKKEEVREKNNWLQMPAFDLRSKRIAMMEIRRRSHRLAAYFHRQLV